MGHSLVLRIAGLFAIVVLFVAGRAQADPINVKPIGATASTSYSGNEPSKAYDGKISTWWNAGVAPTGQPYPWIQLDLGKTVAIQKLRLLPAQTPNGYTIHNISVGQDPNNLVALPSLAGYTYDGRWLEYSCNLNTKCGHVRYVRITTTQSPSWVAWREIEVYQGVEYFGYYGAEISEPTANGANLVWIGGADTPPNMPNWTAKTQQARAAGAKVMVDMSAQLFNMATPGDFTLLPDPDWKIQLKTVMDFITANGQNSFAALYPLDEAYSNAWMNPNIAQNLRDIATEIRKYSTLPIAITLAPQSLGCGQVNCPVSMFDWVGFDCYGPWDDGTNTILCMGNTMQTWIGIVRGMLSTNQRMIAVPPGYEGVMSNGQYPLPTEWDIIQSINAWQAEVTSDPTYIMVMPFTWGLVAAHPRVKERLYQFAHSILRSEKTIYPVTESASTSYPGTDPFMAFDRDLIGGWGSGGSAPASIVADFGGSTRLAQITFTVAQTPAGATTHLIEGLSRGAWSTLGRFQQTTSENQTLTWKGSADVSAVRVTTSRSPSWVAWHEIGFSR